MRAGDPGKGRGLGGGICKVSAGDGPLSPTVRERDRRPAPDLVERDFTTERPNQLWVAEITYIPTWSVLL